MIKIKDSKQNKRELLNELNYLQTLYNSNELTKAENKINKLIKKFPRFANLYNFSGLILKKKREPDKSIKAFKKAIKINPNYTDPYNNLGNLFKEKERFKESIKNFKKAIKINPKLFIAYYNLGMVYKAIGKIEEAKENFLKTIEINPNFYYAHRNLVSIKKLARNDPIISKLEKEFLNIKNNSDFKRELAFTLGKIHEDLFDYKKAFNFFREGNKVQTLNSKYSIKEEKILFSKIMSTFNDKILNYHLKSNKVINTQIIPIFIVGMPRSGTSLVEQILASHKKVFACGEIDLLENLIKKYFFNDNNFIFNERLINKVGNEYIKEVSVISDKSIYVTNKMPLNFKWLSVIKLILPNSKIIHCVRNPRDTCLSIFKNFFPSTKMGFSNSFNDIIEYYHLYNDLMYRWKKILPNFVFDLEYEKLINKSEINIKNLLENLNLNWDKNCLNFYKNNRPVYTASDVQVRKPIYKDSIDLWKKYKNFLPDEFNVLRNY